MFRTAPLVLSVLLVGCAAGSVAKRRNGAPACGVSTTRAFMNRTVSVDGDVATFSGLWNRQVARLDRDGAIHKIGLWDTEAASCRGDHLIIKGLLSDTRSEPI